MSQTQRRVAPGHSNRGRLATVMIATLIALFLVTVGSNAPTEAAFPGDNGNLTYYTDADGPGDIFEIYTSDPDGANPQRLTIDEQGARNPAWSPDGQKIAFQNFAPPDFFTNVWVMDADGGNSFQVTDSSTGGPGSSDENPSWSPDGTRLALQSRRDGNVDIYTINLDGTGRTRLTEQPTDDFAPAWSPDGEQIAFETLRDSSLEIFVMDADGQDQVNLSNDPATDRDPSWSPDGSKIAFARAGDIYVMNADGSQQTQLTDDPGLDIEPAWSPDGQKIAWVSDRDGEVELFVMDADGSGETQITDDDVEQWAPDWEPVVLLQGDIDCDGDADTVDALKGLQFVVGLDPSQEQGCPQIASEVASLFGDVDCDDDVDAVDSLGILRNVAALPVNQQPNCPEIGSPLPLG